MRTRVLIKWHEAGTWLDQIDYLFSYEFSFGSVRDYPRWYSTFERRVQRETLYCTLVDLITNIIWHAVERGLRPPVFKLPGLHIDADWVGKQTLLFRSHTPSWIPCRRRTVINDLITRHISRGEEQARKEMEGKIRRYVANSLLTLPSLVFADKQEMWKEAMGL